ncbi:MAG: hypothetical protein KM310_11100, partial [Clostridiales bacterium]|nr:hypothetical protein [Clostridiales bacterium]
MADDALGSPVAVFADRLQPVGIPPAGEPMDIPSSAISGTSSSWNVRSVFSCTSRGLLSSPVPLQKAGKVSSM